MMNDGYEYLLDYLHIQIEAAKARRKSLKWLWGGWIVTATLCLMTNGLEYIRTGYWGYPAPMTVAFFVLGLAAGGLLLFTLRNEQILNDNAVEVRRVLYIIAGKANPDSVSTAPKRKRPDWRAMRISDDGELIQADTDDDYHDAPSARNQR